MSAPLSVTELEAQIQALSYEDKLRIARFTQSELGEEPSVYDEPPQWVKEELLRREQLVESGLDIPQPWEEVFCRLSKRFQPVDQASNHTN